MKMKLAAAIAALALGSTAHADTSTTSSIFDLTSGAFANAYTFSVTGPSTVTGDTNSSGISWFGVLLQAPGVPYTALDTNPDDGFAFVGLSAGTYALTFLGAGTGGYGGYYTATTTTPPIPEPGTSALVLAGLGMFGLLAKRRRS